MNSKYQINRTKLGFFVGGSLGLFAVFFLVFWFWGDGSLRSNIFDDSPEMLYEVAVQLKDQKNNGSSDDLRGLLMAGDVILVQKEGHEWSKTERMSYLILKMRISENQANKLTEPQREKISEKEAKKDGLIDEEMLKNGSKEELKEMLNKEVKARMYRIKMEKLDFDPAKVRNAQPFADEEFDWKIVEEKAKN